jgi:hypothetical protein
VDIDDLTILANNYDMASGARWGLGDFDFDGDVDLVDLTILATYYGPGAEQAQADFAALTSVPEPATGAALALVGAALTMGRRCRRQRCR